VYRVCFKYNITVTSVHPIVQYSLSKEAKNLKSHNYLRFAIKVIAFVRVVTARLEGLDYFHSRDTSF
jgi:hypothetical protein